MRPRRPARDPQRGNSLLLALIVMSALATLGSLTVVSMQSSIQTATNDRAQAIAMYAAESGAAVAMDFLRQHFDASGTGLYSSATSWSQYLAPSNDPSSLVVMSTYIPSSDAPPGDPNNLFDFDQQAWFNIQLLNNRDDPGFPTGNTTSDTDGVVIIRSTGHGPQGSLAIIECAVQRTGYWGNAAPPPPGFPSFLLLNGNGTAPAIGAGSGWDANWAPLPFPNFGAGPPPFSGFGMVLLGWHIVSL